MRIGVMIGEVRGPATAADLATQAQAADGLASIWSAQALGWDALHVLGLAGQHAPATGLGTAVVPVRQRHPLVLAGAALSVQAATGNRLTLGIGAGIGAMVSGMFGLRTDRTVRYVREYLSVLLPLLHGTTVDHHGEELTAVGSVSIPGTTAPPVLLAALGPAMLRLAGAATDGAITWMTGVRTLESHVLPLVTAAAREAGRPTPRVVAALPVCVTVDETEARQRIGRSFAMAAEVPEYRAVLNREGATGPQDVAIAGDENAATRALKRLASAGASDFVAAPFGTPEEQDRTVRLLHELTRDGASTPPGNWLG
jgi:F420-dependent oxidoreductase-like protein